MSIKPVPFYPYPTLFNPLWFSFEPGDEDKELEMLEQEVNTQISYIEQKHNETVPIGKSGNESYIEDEDEDDEEEDDNEEEESDSHEYEDDEEIDMELEERRRLQRYGSPLPDDD